MIIGTNYPKTGNEGSLINNAWAGQAGERGHRGLSTPTGGPHSQGPPGTGHTPGGVLGSAPRPTHVSPCRVGLLGLPRGPRCSLQASPRFLFHIWPEPLCLPLCPSALPGSGTSRLHRGFWLGGRHIRRCAGRSFSCPGPSACGPKNTQHPTLTPPLGGS